MKKTKGLLVFAGIIVFIIAAVLVAGLFEKDNFSDKYEGVDLSYDVTGLGRENTYKLYKLAHASSPFAAQGFSVEAADFAEAVDAYVTDGIDGVDHVLYTGDTSEVTWIVDVPESGLYNVSMKYYTVESRGVEIEREFLINGEVPFNGADDLAFSRIWTDGGEVHTDNRGNELRPSQVERFEWQEASFSDYLGYEIEPYRFWLEKGSNSITLKAVNEPVIIKSLDFNVISKDYTYSQYKSDHKNLADSAEADSFVIEIDGEKASGRSDASLYARFDKSVSNTDPYSITATKLNYIGGEAWKVPGQWVEWDFEVPGDGFYNITIKGRQSYQRGGISNRKITIDGKLPFEEAQAVGFVYDTDWDMITLSDNDGNAYDFYLTKGKHTIRLEATLAKLGEVLNDLTDSVYRLNLMYRKIIVLTGTNPDTHRDYNIKQVYPDIIEAMGLESKRLFKTVDDYVAITGEKSDQIANAVTLASQLERFNKDPKDITKTLTNFKENIAALGTSINTISESKLDVDYIIVQGKNTEEVKDDAGFFSNLWHDIKSFFVSFFYDYNSIGDVYDEDDEDTIEVWLLAGRDQNNIMKMMVDDTFTPQTGIKVNVQLVAADALLPAVVAGKGPDVVLTGNQQDPVNYALRNAVEDLTQFDDLDEVLSEYPLSSYRSYLFEGGMYALPETLNYNVMFYRKDILEELGLEPPQTWDDLINMLPTIQGNSMTLAVPSTERKIGNVINPDLSLLISMTYQYGGDFYDDQGKKIQIDNEESVRAFSRYTSLFVDYGIPLELDFVTRFRSGEVPIGIADYNTFNTLVLSAPELRGLWDFMPIPGVRKTDENGQEYIDRSVHGWGQCSMMIKTDDERVKRDSWTFLKWWASSETQVRYGRELESVMGSAARYATANDVAFKQLAWSADQIKVLEEQRKWARGFREIAGGYYTSRHLTNAVRKVVNQKLDQREVLLDYTRTINEEITKKRKEYGLETDD